MAEGTAAAFWSYAHQDNEADANGILTLARRVGEEYSLLTGQDLTLFVDRTSLKWGDTWRDRIDAALAETTFFVAIVTPRYFTRPECRRELLEFASQAASLGVGDLLLPIVYSHVPDFNDDNADEAVSLVARTQYFDWTKIRLKGESSAEYRAALNELAGRLVEAAQTVTERQMQREQAAEPIDAGSPLVLDLLTTVNARWSELVDLVEVDRTKEKQYMALWESYSERIGRLKRSGRKGTIPVLEQRLASECTPLAEDHLRLTREYAALSVELNPSVISLFRYAGSSQDVSDVLTDLRADIEDINERIDVITRYNMRYLDYYAGRSRGMAHLRQLFLDGTQYADEGNEILRGWREIARRDSKACEGDSGGAG